MHRTRVIGHRYFCTPNECRQLSRCGFTRQITCPGRCGCDFPATLLVAHRARQCNGKAIVKRMPRDACKSFNRPMFSLPDGAGHENDKGHVGSHTLLLEQLLHVTHSVGWQVNSEIWWIVVEAKQRPDPEVTINCVNIECRNRDAVGIGNP